MYQHRGCTALRGTRSLTISRVMADLCLLNIPGALREMSARFGYRCVILSDCTTAYEFPDTLKDRAMTKAAIRLVETDLGYSTSADEFITDLSEVS